MFLVRFDISIVIIINHRFIGWLKAGDSETILFSFAEQFPLNKMFRFNNVCSWQRMWNYYTEGIIKAPNLLSPLSTVRFCNCWHNVQCCFICLLFFLFLRSRGISLCQWLKNTIICRGCGAPELKHTLFKFVVNNLFVFNFLTRVVKFPRKLQSFLLLL